MQRVLHLTAYKLGNPHVEKDLKFFILSDVHFNPKLSNQKLNRLKTFIKAKNPDYILLGGDLLDNADVVINPAERKRLMDWLKNLANIAPVLYALGNHEFYHQNPAQKQKKSRQKWLPELNKDFLKDLAKIKNLHLLDDAIFEDNNTAIFGLTLTPAYFAQSYAPRSLLPDPKSEKKPELLKSLKKHQKTFSSLPKNKPKLILIHSPVYLTDPDVAELLKSFDFIISGHMHNGVVPPLLDELWPSDRGFISPTKKLLTNNTRRTLKTVKDKLLTVGAVTTFSRPGLRGFNAPYPVYLATLTLSKQPTAPKTAQKFPAKKSKKPQKTRIKRKYIIKH